DLFPYSSRQEGERHGGHPSRSRYALHVALDHHPHDRRDRTTQRPRRYLARADRRIGRRMTGERSDALTQALRGRTDLFTALTRVESVLAAPTGRDGWLDKVRAELGPLRDALDAHVDITEGDNGLFADVIDTAPRLAHQIDVLRTEHDEIEQALDELMHIGDATTL